MRLANFYSPSPLSFYTMLPVSFLTLASVLLGATAQNLTSLQQSLFSSGVSAVYPTDSNYSTVTQACMYNAWRIFVFVFFDTKKPQTTGGLRSPHWP